LARWASAINRFSSGLESSAPDMPLSTNSEATFQLRRRQNSRSSVSCIPTSWPRFVETRAYIAALSWFVIDASCYLTRQ
jgi:hypothetical protein